MNRGIGVLAFAALALSSLWAAAACAQEGRDTAEDSLDVTMTLLPEGATRPDAVTRVIELPAVAARGSDASAEGAAAGRRSADSGGAARGAAPAGADGRGADPKTSGQGATERQIERRGGDGTTEGTAPAPESDPGSAGGRPDVPAERGNDAAAQDAGHGDAGRSVADQARDLGRDFGRNAADQAQEHRDSRSTTDRPEPAVPDHPEAPARPEVPGRSH